MQNNWPYNATPFEISDHIRVTMEQLKLRHKVEAAKEILMLQNEWEDSICPEDVSWYIERLEERFVNGEKL
jgi:hypothetical protein